MTSYHDNDKPRRVLVIGSGPTGLGAAYRLNELNEMHKLGVSGGAKCEWTLLERSDIPGGLAMSFLDDNGFTWDVGGHVIFSHFEYYTKVLDHVCPKDGWNFRIREAWVWMRDRFIPYPFQNNIWRLPNDDLVKCLTGLVDVQNRVYDKKAGNFAEWLQRGFGDGLCEVFMYPYNFKVWACHPRDMNVEWMGERVATVDMARVLRNMVEKRDEMGWGPNNTFRFPKHGGTGSIYKHLFNSLPSAQCRLNTEVVSIDAKNKTVTLKSGEVLEFDQLISTMPLDILCRTVKNVNKLSDEELVERSRQFKFSATHVVGIGIDGETPEVFRTKCWNYFPEDNCPFYRVTVFSNYSENNVAKPGEQWSLMCEVSESVEKPVNLDTIVEDTIQGLKNVKFLLPEHKIVSTFSKRLEYGYPTPFVGRDDLCSPLFEALEEHGIYSRGRFGAWKYEVANQDHSMMQGVECVDHILFQSEEMVFKYPSIVNRGKDQPGKKALCMMMAKD